MLGVFWHFEEVANDIFIVREMLSSPQQGSRGKAQLRIQYLYNENESDSLYPQMSRCIRPIMIKMCDIISVKGMTTQHVELRPRHDSSNSVSPFPLVLVHSLRTA